ncbi:hypothetical protein BC936DRAFT_147705 [Jimgerdemannia flammicorona]|uniref:Uncharacterized protein n=1 Tax=Jimgerdemannia flammicorona TaxID=994334 RepID=A0A433D4M2_9FUNG|nr:hypothetical protein BC936DRAFT_147705 [Jimgerdemannia flammicorona]
MADLPPEELNILESLVSIRNRLSALKKDRNSYIKAADVLALYDETLQQVSILYEVRSHDMWEQQKENRVDSLLDDVFQLLSLFFMAIGKNKESPATYVQLTTIKRCLDQLNELGVYLDESLTPFQERLDEIRGIIDTDVAKMETPGPQILLLRRKLDQCSMYLSRVRGEEAMAIRERERPSKVLHHLSSTLSTIAPELQPTQKRLVEIRRELATLGARRTFHTSDVRTLQEELRAIDNMREDGKFLAPDGTIPAGQALVIGLLEQCFDDAHDLIASKDEISPSLLPIYARLQEIKASLERLSLTHRWTLRETDLFAYQMQLQEIDAMRKDGKFYDEEGEAPEGQAMLNFLLHRSYRLVYKLLSESEPVAEALMPIHNQLTTVRRCLVEVKKYGGPFTARELYPYQMKLTSIDNMRVEGKFIDEEGNIPEGE